jgi:D-alanyl-D-alanine dipeptidase
MSRLLRRLWPAAPSYVAAVLFLGAAGSVIAQGEPPLVRDAARARQILVELITLDSTMKLDIRYASANNFLGRPVYTEARAFLIRPAADALVRVHRRLREDGYGILVFDGYRPWSVTRTFWEATPPSQREYVADPSKGSRHNRGCAVDVSLYDLATGEEVQMPSPYDDFTARAGSSFAGGTPIQRDRRDLLRRVMEEEGYLVYTPEWWHFDFNGWQSHPLLDVPFEQLH